MLSPEHPDLSNAAHQLSPRVTGRTPCDACRSHRARALQRHRDRHLHLRHRPHVRRRTLRPPGARVAAPARPAGDRSRPADAPERRRGDAALPRRSRSRVRPVGCRAGCRDDGLGRLGRRVSLSERHGQLHRADVRGRHHDAGVDAADRRVRRARAAARSRTSAAARRWPGGSPSSPSGPLLGLVRSRSRQP